MFTTKNRSQRWRRFCPVMLLSLTMLSPPRLALEILGSGAGGLAGRVSVPGNAQENFLTAVLQVKPCNFIVLK